MGCQDLLEEVPGRSRRDKDILSSPGDLRSFVKGVTSRSSSKSYSVKDETSSKFHTQSKSEVVSHFWDRVTVTHCQNVWGKPKLKDLNVMSPSCVLLVPNMATSDLLNMEAYQ